MIQWLVRIGCAIGILLIAAVGVLVLLGGGRNITHLQTVVTFNQPAARIWPWLIEAPRLKQWLGGFVDSIPEDGGGLRLGARRTELIDLDGHREEIQAEVTALAPRQRLKLHRVADGFVDDSEYVLTEHDGVTDVTYTSEAHFPRLTQRLMAPLICHDVERKLQADLAKLRELLDREPETTIAPPKPGNKPAFAGCCAPDPTTHAKSGL